MEYLQAVLEPVPHYLDLFFRARQCKGRVPNQVRLHRLVTLRQVIFVYLGLIAVGAEDRI